MTSVPGARKEIDLTLDGLRVTVQTFSDQLGAFVDIFHDRIYEQLPAFCVEPGQTVLDAGANVGFYTLRQARAVGPHGHVYAFEPNPEVYALLVKNVRQNGFGWVTCFPQALSDVEGSLVLQGSTQHTSVMHTHRPEPGIPTLGVDIKGTTLDSFADACAVERIDLLKMDTEGAEADIVCGGLERALPVTERVVMESHNTRYQVRDLLSPLGFHLALDYRKAHVAYFERGR